MPLKVGVVIPAKDEERFLPRTLRALKAQSRPPDFIIVVDDGSKDRTAEIAEKSGALVIRLPDRGFRATGLPLVAGVINAGLRVARDEGVDFVMILGADHVLSRDYIKRLLRLMLKDPRLAVCSGVIVGEPIYPDMPRGSGRLIRASWFEKIGFRYPVWWGYESWLIFKALSMGMRVAVDPGAVSWVQRRTAWSPREMYEWGRGMRALGYHPVYALARCALALRRGPRALAYMLVGYLTPTEQYSDVRCFVRRYTASRLFGRFAHLLRLGA